MENNKKSHSGKFVSSGDMNQELPKEKLETLSLEQVA
jgi:hypothetical protein